jgi:hypothetical protein
MVKANELRIGNYVKDEFGRIGTIKILFQNTVSIKLKHSKLKTGYKNIEPIPITEEILLACGITFHHVNGFRKYFNYKDHIMIEILNNKQVCVYFMDNILCFKTYLHELQNMFKIWDIELEINL